MVECDGQYMLIDGGPKGAENKVYEILREKEVQRLEILAISHLHDDHIGGLPKALTYASTIGLVLTNSDNFDSVLQSRISNSGARIVIPRAGDQSVHKYKLGSATIEVIENESTKNNDSLVLMITYKKTRFLFTGDIEESAQTRISNLYQSKSDEAFQIDLIKMPHHGAYNDTLYRFLRTFMPDYAIISVGKGNRYGHPDQKTLDLLSDLKRSRGTKLYRTDLNGNILVKSNGRTVTIKPDK